MQQNRVDRCPANNEEWRNNMCTVVSCPTGQEIKNNACVDKPKPVTPVEPPVVTPPAVDKSQCISDSSRKSDTSCKDDYYLTRINDKSLSGGDLLGYGYIISGDDARYTGKGTITIGATKDWQTVLGADPSSQRERYHNNWCYQRRCCWIDYCGTCIQLISKPSNTS